MPFTERIESSLGEMRPSEADVARRILREPAYVAANSLRDVAAWCGTSDATVLRACRAAGFDGFQDLKYHVLREFTTRGAVQHSQELTDSIPLEDMQASLTACQPSLRKAASMLRRSKRVVVVGSGASGGVGHILVDVLCALGKHALSLSDEQAISFAMAPSTANLMLVAISHSGETRFPLHAVREAKRAKVRTLGITNEPGSELARIVDILLPTRAVERPEGSFSIVPRQCQLTVLDGLIRVLRNEDCSKSGESKRKVERKQHHPGNDDASVADRDVANDKRASTAPVETGRIDLGAAE